MYNKNNSYRYNNCLYNIPHILDYEIVKMYFLRALCYVRQIIFLNNINIILVFIVDICLQLLL